MGRHGKPRRGGGWFLVIAAILVLALLGVITAAIVDVVTGEDDEPAERLSAAETASASDEDATATARARAFYQRLVERRLGEAARLAAGDALARVQALQAGGREAAADPALAEVIDETLRGRLEAFEVIGPVRQTGQGTRELVARAVVYMAEQPRTVRIWFALRQGAGGWRVEDYRPEANTSP